MVKTEMPLRFGALVREQRVAKGLSQEEFAIVCGVHRTYVGSVERGEKTVTIETANRFAKALEIPLSRMFATLEQNSDMAHP